jgi:hypothetical protein
MEATILGPPSKLLGANVPQRSLDYGSVKLTRGQQLRCDQSLPADCTVLLWPAQGSQYRSLLAAVGSDMQRSLQASAITFAVTAIHLIPLIPARLSGHFFCLLSSECARKGGLIMRDQ